MMWFLFLLCAINEKIRGKMKKKYGQCPCCEYYSIGFGEEGLWDICPVCFWENGGDGGPNHMTLEEAKKNFKQFGAIDKKCLDFIDPESKNKYKRKKGK